MEGFKLPEPNSLDSMEGVPELGSDTANERVDQLEQLPITELIGEDWQIYRDLRLKSGQTDPKSWGSSILKEADKDEVYWRSKLDDPNFRLFAAKVEGRAAAMAGLEQKPDGRLFLRRVYSEPEMRGRGLARSLMDKVFAEAKARGAKSIFLGVTEGIPAVEMYRKLGFRELYVRPDRIRGDGQPSDEIIMEKQLES